jgi:hypothetical protein
MTLGEEKDVPKKAEDDNHDVSRAGEREEIC